MERRLKGSFGLAAKGFRVKHEQWKCTFKETTKSSLLSLFYPHMLTSPFTRVAAVLLHYLYEM